MSHPCSEGHGRPLFLCPQANLDVLWMEWRTSFLPRAAPLGPEPRTVGSVPRGDTLSLGGSSVRWAVRGGLHPTVPRLQTGKPSKPRCPLPPPSLQGHSQLAQQWEGAPHRPVRARLELTDVRVTGSHLAHSTEGHFQASLPLVRQQPRRCAPLLLLEPRANVSGRVISSHLFILLSFIFGPLVQWDESVLLPR